MAKKKKKQSDVFVGIHDPIEVRRNILESSRDMIQSLQSYEKLKLIRAEKDHSMKMLKSSLKEIKLMIADLQDEMPQTKVRAPRKRPTPKKEEKPKKVRKIPKTPSELEKLENALDDIEHKLSTLA